MKKREDFNTTTNSRVYKLLWRDLCAEISCSYCPPNRGENARSRSQNYPVKKAYELSPERQRRIKNKNRNYYRPARGFYLLGL